MREIYGEKYKMSDLEFHFPIKFNFDKYDFPAAEVIDKYTYRIHFKEPYTKFLYWLAMPFFTAMPKEADEFYSQSQLRRYTLHLNTQAVGTGPYYLRKYYIERIELWKNPLYRDVRYPSEGEEGDKEKGTREV